MDIGALVNLEPMPVKLRGHADFAELEGAVPEDEQALVLIRRVNEGDNILRQELLGKREVQYGGLLAEIIDGNPRERMAYEVYLTLVDVKFVSLNGQPLFTALPARNMKLTDFQREWGRLPIVAASAIYRAVIEINPEWG